MLTNSTMLLEVPFHMLISAPLQLLSINKRTQVLRFHRFPLLRPQLQATSPIPPWPTTKSTGRELMMARSTHLCSPRIRVLTWLHSRLRESEYSRSFTKYLRISLTSLLASLELEIYSLPYYYISLNSLSSHT